MSHHASTTMSTSTTTHHPSMTSSGAHAGHTNKGNSTGPGPTSKPLLFFVALGFGVVFTNLWIIVGVKYCFRYNQRARQAEIARENGEPIDLANMHRPRRRKEKKLMSMEEVNERFPLTKYKIWRATREHEGLPAAGGITAPPSRAASIKDSVARISAEARRSDEETFSTPTTSAPVQEDQIPATTTDLRKSQEQTRISLQEKRDVSVPANEGSSEAEGAPKISITIPREDLATVDDDDEDDPIRTAVPAELLAHPGDTCAICLDTLEDDDEVRGLTCGHAFHASCLDPWLTSRRACCPLCKADFYIPKPRPEGETGNEDEQQPRRGRRRGDITMPDNAWIPGRGAPFRPRIIIGGARFQIDHHDRYGFPILTRERISQRERQRRRMNNADNEEQPAEAEQQEQEQQQQPQGFGARFMSNVRSIPSMARSFRPPPNASTPATRAEEATAPQQEQNQQPSETVTSTTPGQLEAGEHTS